MPKTFSVQADYAAAPDAVLATATDADAVTAKFTALGAHDVEVVSRTDTADGVRIEVTRKQDVDVPGFAKKVLQPTNSIRLVEDWKRTADGAAATWKAEISPARATLTGTRTLTASGTGTTERIEGTAKASVPLIGGKLAEFVATETAKALDDEQAWIAKRVAR